VDRGGGNYYIITSMKLHLPRQFFDLMRQNFSKIAAHSQSTSEACVMRLEKQLFFLC
jgi:hypothetical protein